MTKSNTTIQLADKVTNWLNIFIFQNSKWKIYFTNGNAKSKNLKNNEKNIHSAEIFFLVYYIDKSQQKSFISGTGIIFSIIS